MKKSLFNFLLLALIAVSASCSQGSTNENQSAQAQFLRVEGRDIITPQGDKFFIQGTNLGNWLNPEGYMFGFRKCNSPRMINDAFCQMIGPDATAKFWKQFKDNYITEADIKFIASTGANTVRLPFHYKLFTDEDYMGLDAAQDGFQRIDSLVSWCRNADLKLILDMHDAPGGQTGDNIDDSWGGYPWLMVSEESQDKFCDIWEKIAERYADEPVILGYELINEPVATYFGDEQDALNTALIEVLKKGLAAIREVDQNHIVLIGSPQWNSNFKPLEGVDFNDHNIMFTCHRYGGDPTAEAIKSYIDFRDSTNRPMYMGEIGHNTTQWQADFVKAMKENNIMYTFWPYKKCKDSCMNGFDLPENWDRIIEFTEADRSSYAETRKNRPETAMANAAMEQLLQNIKFENCHPQNDYIESMGMK